MSSIELDIDGPIARLTLDYPGRHNALTRDGLEQMHARLGDIENNTGIRVLIVTGKGDTTFCSGAALDDVQAGLVDGETFQSVADRLAALHIPKLAAMNGSAYGGGVEIGLCCDFRCGVEDMRIRVPAAAFGLCYPPNGIERFVSRLGVGPAKRILVAAETLDSAELLRIGYLHRRCPRDSLNEVVDAWAKQLAGLAPLATRAMIALADAVAEGTLDAELARQWVTRCNDSADLQEGLAAAIEKRTPEFKGE